MSACESLVFMLALITKSTSIFDVDTFTVTIADEDTAATSASVNFTLWWNHTIYQYSIAGPRRAASYTANSSSYTVIGSSLCNPAEVKLRIECNGGNLVIIDRVQVNTTDGAWYGAESYCHANRYSYGDIAQWEINDGACSNGRTHLTRICIEKSECAPYQQMVHFDLSKPNQWDSTALVEDGTGITAQVTTCDPTNSPSTTPSEHPSVSSTEPTSNPSAVPSEQPSNPSSPPSQQPSATPSTIPTGNPSVPPSAQPTSLYADFASTTISTAETSFVSETEDEALTSHERRFEAYDMLLMTMAGVAIGILLFCIILFAAYKCRRVHHVKSDEVHEVEIMVSRSNHLRDDEKVVNISMTSSLIPVNNTIRSVISVRDDSGGDEHRDLTVDGNTPQNPGDGNGVNGAHRRDNVRGLQHVREMRNDLMDDPELEMEEKSVQEMFDPDNKVEGDPGTAKTPHRRDKHTHGTTAGTDPGQS